MKPSPIKETISFEDFEKLDIRVLSFKSPSELLLPYCDIETFRAY